MTAGQSHKITEHYPVLQFVRNTGLFCVLFKHMESVQMKIYITARFKGDENKADIERLCQAVRGAGIQDFCFVRDVENYQKTFDNPADLWERSLVEIKNCDALLIDVSDAPSGGRVVEAGIAYALGLPVFVIARTGVPYKEVFKGISATVIIYDEYSDITERLTKLTQAA